MSLSDTVNANKKNGEVDKKEQDDLLNDLKVWFKQHRIWYNKKYIRIHHSVTDYYKTSGIIPPAENSEDEVLFERRCSTLNYDIPTSGYDFGIMAIKDIPEDTLVCRIPKESLISWKTGGLSNILEDDCIGGGIALVLTLMYEIKLKEKSPWYGYLKTLQSYESLPVLWSSSELEFLIGTEAYEETCSSRIDIEEDYNELVVPLFTKYPEAFDKKFFSLENFFKASSLVSSRAFEVDSYHGDAMVPLADLFNHKSGAEHVHIESLNDVCDMCGAVDSCPHDVDEFDSDSVDPEEAVGSNVSPISSTAVIVGTDSIEELVSLAPGSEPDSHSEVEEVDDEGSVLLDEEDYFDCIGDFDRKNTLDMRMFRPALAGSELFNTYGERSSSYLLVKYGFAELDNVNESIRFTLETVLDTCAFVAGISTEDVNRRFDFFTNCNEILEAAHDTELDNNSEMEEEYDSESAFEHQEVGSQDNESEEASKLDNDEDHEDHEDGDLNEVHSEEQPESYNSEDEGSVEDQDSGKKPVFRILYGGRVETSFLVLLHTMFMDTRIIKMLASSDEFESLVSFYFARVIAQWETITAVESDNEVPDELLLNANLDDEPKTTRNSNESGLSPNSDNPKRFKSAETDTDAQVKHVPVLPTADNSCPQGEEDLGQYRDLLPDPEIAHKLAEVLQTLIETRLSKFPNLEPPYLSATKEDPVLLKQDFKLLNEALPPYDNSRIQFSMMCRIAEKTILSKCLDSLPI